MNGMMLLQERETRSVYEIVRDYNKKLNLNEMDNTPCPDPLKKKRTFSNEYWMKRWYIEERCMIYDMLFDYGTVNHASMMLKSLYKNLTIKQVPVKCLLQTGKVFKILTSTEEVRYELEVEAVLIREGHHIYLDKLNIMTREEDDMKTVREIDMKKDVRHHGIRNIIPQNCFVVIRNARRKGFSDLFNDVDHVKSRLLSHEYEFKEEFLPQ